jgi:hypothetical protein
MGGPDPAEPEPAWVRVLRNTVNEVGWEAGGEAAHRYADALEELLPSVASAHYLRASMQYELSRPATEPVHVADILGLERCEIPVERHELAYDAVDTEYLAETLSRLYRARADQMRHDRLMSNLRRSYLPRVALVIVGALALMTLAVLTGEADAADLGTWNEMLLAAALGALGGALASTLKLRDIAELNPFRSVVTFLLMQPLVGAALGLVSWIVLASGLVEFGTSDVEWAMSGVVAFLAGY